MSTDPLAVSFSYISMDRITPPPFLYWREWLCWECLIFCCNGGILVPQSFLNAFSDAFPQEEIDFCGAKKLGQFEKD